MKDEKGITLIALVISVIVIAILSGIAVNSLTGKKGDITETKKELLIAEVKQVQQAVLEAYIKYKQTGNENYLVHESEITNIETYLEKVGETPKLSGMQTEMEKKYYQLGENELKQIGIKGSKETYIVNYFTGEVFNSLTQKTVDGEKLYVSK